MAETEPVDAADRDPAPETRNQADPDPADPALGSRYGRTRERRRRDRLVLVLAGLATAVVLVAWVIWAGLDGSGPQLEAKDLSHQLLNDERAVEVTWQLSVTPGSETACAVQAMDEDFTIVGWKIVEIPASADYNRTFTERVRVAREAVTGLISRCWLT